MITAQLATIPGRESSLKLTMKSLSNQVDKLQVAFNGFTDDQLFEPVNPDDDIRTLRICSYGDPDLMIWKRLDNSTGDAAKFYNIETIEGYFFSCDDDLIYPPDYVQYMISKIEQYQRKAIITLHGRNYQPGKIGKYYGSSYRTEAYHCLANVEGDHQVMIGGTGVMAFHTDTIRVLYDEFKAPNMADLWMGIFAKQQGVPIIVAEHRSGWLQLGYDGEDTIWNKHFNDDSLQTEIYNKYMV